MSGLALPLAWKVAMFSCNSVKLAPITSLPLPESHKFSHLPVPSLLSFQGPRSASWPSLAVQDAEFQLLRKWWKCFHCLNSKSCCTGSTGKALLAWNIWSLFPVKIPRFFSEVTLPLRCAAQVNMAVLSSFAHNRREFRAISHNLSKLKWMLSVVQN